MAFPYGGSEMQPRKPSTAQVHGDMAQLPKALQSGLGHPEEALSFLGVSDVDIQDLMWIGRLPPMEDIHTQNQHVWGLT